MMKDRQSKISVMHVVQYIEIGGLETLIVELCKHADFNRFKVSILCLNGYDEAYVKGLKEFGVDVFLIKKSCRFDNDFFRRVYRLIKEKNIDILHAHGGCFLYAALFAAFFRVSLFLYTAHGMPIFNTCKDIIEENLAALLSDHIVAVSDEILITLTRRLPLTRKKLSLIRNGIDTEKFKPFSSTEERQAMASRYALPSDAFIIGSVGRLEPVKNYPMLLRAFAHFSANTKGSNVHLVFIGEGSSRSELESFTNELGLVGKVSYLGMQYQVNEVLPLFNVFVLSSLTEGTSISLLEAQSCGVPAVVTDVGGNGFVVRQGENGFLCAIDDVDAMAEALCRLQNEPEMAQRMGQAARLRVNDCFDLDSMLRQYQYLYLQV